MKVLAIGNSFSQNTTAYLNGISKKMNHNIKAVNLYIAACSLEMHAENIQENKKNYEYQVDGKTLKHTSIREVIENETFDVITIQQYSGDSGILESYEPYFKYIYDYLRKYCPKSEILFHKTWSYEKNSGHIDFDKYNKSQQQMDAMIDKVASYIKRNYGLRSIPSAQAVKAYRLSDAKDHALSLDGHHLNTKEGLFLGAMVWFYFLSNADKIENLDLLKYIDIHEKVKEIINDISYKSVDNHRKQEQNEEK